MVRRGPRESAKKRIFIESRANCYHPDCDNPLVEDGVIVGEIAHICALNEGGARYDPSLDDDQVNDHSNLIALCLNHHRIVDSRPADYPPDQLRQWKRARMTLDTSPLKELVAALFPNELEDWSLEAGAPRVPGP